VTDHANTCAKCGGAMEAGFVLDQTHGGLAQSSWVDGAPERSVWFGIKLKGHRRLLVTTARCLQCGYLESYARDSRK
jgi:predicted nucleic-acid-binding Zn-ribbon protein